MSKTCCIQQGEGIARLALLCQIPQLQCSLASRDDFGRGTHEIREERCTRIFPQEENGTREEKNIVMSNIMKPPPEYHAPTFPNYTPVSSSSQQPRKSYHWVWITLVILVLVCIVVGALLIWGLGSAIIVGALLIWGLGSAFTIFGSPTITCDEYYNAIRDQDYSRAYSFLGSGVKARLSQEAFTQQAQQQDGAYGHVRQFFYANGSGDDPASVILTVTRANGTSSTVNLEMRQEGGAWKITTFDRI